MNLRVEEKFNDLIVTWHDPHTLYDPIEFSIICDSRTNVPINLHRNTTYTCQQMIFEDTESITVLTQVAIPGYSHPDMATKQIGNSL
jgi:hypothetical protein